MQAMSSTLRDVAKQTTILIFDGIKYASMIFYLYLSPTSHPLPIRSHSSSYLELLLLRHVNANGAPHWI